jgi:UDP-N-acetylmuramoyl-tripeptide--D-alanyl-D-alanine ligase
VIEMGANHHGEIAYLTGLTKPDVALITNAGAAHLEGFGSVAGVASAKGEIYQGLTETGVAVINEDDDYAELWQGLAGSHKILGFGLGVKNGHKPDVTAEWSGDEHGSQLVVTTPTGGFECRLALAGQHNVLNALAATAAATAVGVSLENIRQGLENMQPVAGRMQTRVGMNGASIIDDTYNANPYSLQAALDVLALCEGEKYLALGDMGELGDDAVVLHARAGKQARDSGVDRLYAIGDNACNSVEAFGNGAQHFGQYDAMIDALRNDLSDNVTLLVKGSRSMHMERIVEALTGEK